MIKVENGTVKIESKEGIAGVLTDTTVMLKSVYEVLSNEVGKEEAEKLLDDALRRAKATTEELKQEAADCLMEMLKSLFKGERESSDTAQDVNGEEANG